MRLRHPLSLTAAVCLALGLLACDGQPSPPPPPKAAPKAPADEAARPKEDSPQEAERKQSLKELGYNEEYWGDPSDDDWETRCMGGDSPEQAHALTTPDGWMSHFKEPVRACHLHPGIMVIQVKEGQTLKVSYEPLNKTSDIRLVLTAYDGTVLARDAQKDARVEASLTAQKRGLYFIVLHSTKSSSVGVFQMEIL